MGATSSLNLSNNLLPITVEDAHKSYNNCKKDDHTKHCKHPYVYYLHDEDPSKCCFRCSDCHQEIIDNFEAKRLNLASSLASFVLCTYLLMGNAFAFPIRR